MNDPYANLAEEYEKAKHHHPWRLYIEDFTLFELIGDLTGKTVLDLACGEGFYTRRIKQTGAARVMGVDVSEKMIDLARAKETKSPLGIEYVIQDATQIRLPICFDLVVAAYLLNHARTKEELLAMCQAVSSSLKPGCRFIAVNNNAEQPVESFSALRKYGCMKTIAGNLQEGTPITITLFVEDRSFSFDDYYLSTRTYEWALGSAGFREILWHPPRLSPQGEAQFGKEYWVEFLDQPPLIFLECIKD